MKARFLQKFHQLANLLLSKLSLASDDLLSVNKVPAVGVVILARAHYREIHKTYPINHPAELRKVLANEYSDKTVCHYIVATDSQQSKVITYLIAEAVAAKLPSMSVLLPVSLLAWAQLRQSYQSSVVLLQALQQPFYLSLTQIPLSQVVNAFCATEQQFRLNNGVSDELPAFELCTTHFSLLPVLAALGFKHIRYFSYIRPGQAIRWDKKLLVTLAGAGVCYLALVYGYLTYMTQHRQQQLDLTMAQAAGILAVADKFEATNNALQVVNQRLRSAKAADRYFELLHYLLEKKIEVTTFSLNEAGLMLRGSVSSATELLSDLKQLPIVESAVFESPASRADGKERFVIRVVTKQDPLDSSAPTEKPAANTESTVTAPERTEAANTGRKEQPAPAAEQEADSAGQSPGGQADAA